MEWSGVEGRRITCVSKIGSLASPDHLRLRGFTCDSDFGSLVPPSYLEIVRSSNMFLRLMLTVAKDPNLEVQAIQNWRYKQSKFGVLDYAHISHLGFIGVGGGEHSTYIIRFEALCSQQPFRSFRVYWGGVGNILLTSSVLRPYAHSSHLGFIGVGGGKHSTYIIRFEALCSQQPFRAYWGGWGTFYLHHPLSCLMLTAAI